MISFSPPPSSSDTDCRKELASVLGRLIAENSIENRPAHNRPTALPTPNPVIDAVALRDGRVVLIYNNTTTGRTPLNLAVSAAGEHFKIFATLEDQPGEYSYPAIIRVPMIPVG